MNRIVSTKKAIATIPLVKFSFSGGILCPTIPYTTEAIAHKQAANKAATSPLPLVIIKIKELLKIQYLPKFMTETL